MLAPLARTRALIQRIADCDLCKEGDLSKTVFKELLQWLKKFQTEALYIFVVF